MATRAITSEDLLKQRIEITKEQADYRHEQSAIFQENILNYYDKLEDKIDKMYEESKAFHKEILERHDKLEQKFAGKWTEKVLIAVGATIGLAVLTALLALVINGKT